MSLKLHGLGKITGIDQGLSVVGVTTLHNELSVSGDVVVGGGLTVTGVLTYEDVTNVDSIGIITARSGIVGDLTGNVTGDITGNIIGSPTLSGISSSISDTAVDVFVYDTSKDSDGGAWRKRTTHTSWYNETLNTSTRGSRREFPAVAVIVAESSTVTIYDGDDPDLPMWMVFNRSSSSSSSSWTFLGGTPDSYLSSVSGINGLVVVGTNQTSVSGFAATVLLNFISEKVSIRYFNGSFTTGNDAFVNRNLVQSFLGSTSGAIISGLTNDVAMTVLPSAPIDSATGLPVPTIALATDGGTSIIKGDGTVIDITPYSDDYVAFDNNNLIIGRGDGSAIVYAGPMPNADISEVTWRGQSDVTYFGSSANIELYSSDYDPGNLTGVTKNAFSFDSSIGKVVKFDLNTNDANSTMVAYAATSYNTGWMHGDIKGAFLSDTDATNVTGSELVTNGTFASDISGWTQYDGPDGNGGLVTYNSGKLQVNLNGYYDQGVYQDITVETNTEYVLTADLDFTTSFNQLDNVVYIIYDNANTSNALKSTSFTSDGTYSVYFKSHSSNTTHRLLIRSASSGNTTGVYTLDNISIKKVERDHSVNNKGLQVFGTITKSAVATGADLVAYSGFTDNDYLTQPFNSDLEFGTGDYYMSIWAKGGGDSQCLMIREHGVSSGNGLDADGAILIFQGGNKYNFYSRQNGTANWTSFAATNATYGNYWSHVVLVRTGGTLYGYVNGKLEGSTSFAGDVSNDDAEIYIGRRNPNVNNTQEYSGSLALAKIGGSAPSAEQIKKMYEDEKHLFQENAKATLYGSSDNVTALGYDEDTELLHVGTSAGRSDFQGLRRINNTTTAVTTAISASDELIAEQ